MVLNLKKMKKNKKKNKGIVINLKQIKSFFLREQRYMFRAKIICTFIVIIAILINQNEDFEWCVDAPGATDCQIDVCVCYLLDDGGFGWWKEQLCD